MTNGLSYDYTSSISAVTTGGFYLSPWEKIWGGYPQPSWILGRGLWTFNISGFINGTNPIFDMEAVPNNSQWSTNTTILPTQKFLQVSALGGLSASVTVDLFPESFWIVFCRVSGANADASNWENITVDGVRQ